MSLPEILRIQEPESEIQRAVFGRLGLHQFLESADQPVELIDDREDC